MLIKTKKLVSLSSSLYIHSATFKIRELIKMLEIFSSNNKSKN